MATKDSTTITIISQEIRNIIETNITTHLVYVEIVIKCGYRYKAIKSKSIYEWDLWNHGNRQILISRKMFSLVTLLLSHICTYVMMV